MHGFWMIASRGLDAVWVTDKPWGRLSSTCGKSSPAGAARPSPSRRRCRTLIARGRAGPQLLAQVLFGKFGAHLPLNRQSEIYAKEGIDLDVSTLADWVGASAATLMPLVQAIARHVFAAERIHADDSVLQKHTERMICMI